MTVSLITLSDLELLQLSGPDSERLLQGQVTCDMQKLSTTQALPGAYCTVKGRVITDFLALQHDHNILLRTPPGLAGSLQQTLGKYAVFFDTSLEQVSDQWQCHGLLGEQANLALEAFSPDAAPASPWQCWQQTGCLVVRLPGPVLRYEIISQPSHPLLEAISGHCQPGTLEQWQLADMQSGLYPLEFAETGQFTPQVLNHDLLGLVDFRKGCYTGQEIIARMHYRGKAKRRLFTLHSEQPVNTKLQGLESLYVSSAAGAANGKATVNRLLADSDGILWLQTVLDVAAVEAARSGDQPLQLFSDERSVATLRVETP